MGRNGYVLWECGNSKLWFHWNSVFLSSTRMASGHMTTRGEWFIICFLLLNVDIVDRMIWCLCVCRSPDERRNTRINKQHRLWPIMTYPFDTCVRTYFSGKRNRFAPSVNFNAVFIWIFRLCLTTMRSDRSEYFSDALNLPASALNSNSTKKISLCFDFEFECDARQSDWPFAIWVTYNSIRFCSHFFFRSFFSPVNNCRFAHIRIDNRRKRALVSANQK